MIEQNPINRHTLLIEAESFDDFGGWKLDTEFIHVMGSPYLIAHGLGKPVAPAKTTVTLPDKGRWFVWVRTKNWVPGAWEAPGRFKIAVNDCELPVVFGTESGDWGWQSGGSVELEHKNAKLSLIDLAGFDGRCDAILFTRNQNATPDNSSDPMCEWRKEYSDVREIATDITYDLVVVGGGIAGTSAAIAAARAGLAVALIQSQSLLGGNSSSEVRVTPCGDFPPGNFPRLGEIVKEMKFEITESAQYPGGHEEAEELRRTIVEAEPNIDLMINHYVYDVEMNGTRISAVWALETHAKSYRCIKGRMFVDSTGHGTLGLKAGADYQLEPRDRMGMSNLWRWIFTEEESSFPDTPWALPLTENGFPYPTDGGWAMEDGEIVQPLKFAPVDKMGRGDWYWESGFSKHPLDDLEAIRDHNLRAVFGAWNAMKNHGAYAFLDQSGHSHATAELVWLAYHGGPRETLQLLGDVVVSKEDIYSYRSFLDGCVPATWGIDLHYPLPLWARETPDNPFISRAHFDGYVDDTQGEWANSPKPCVLGAMREVYDREVGYLFPYRSFYSRNIENLFMAGRNLSCTHEALGTIRVMNTLGMVGVVVGRAASIALKHETTPRGVYEKHWDELKAILKLPGDNRAGRN